MNARTELADRIQAGLPDVQVYPSPDDVTILPAVVLSPDDPYWEVSTFGSHGRPGAIVWNLEVWIAVQRTIPEIALENIEELATRVLEVVSGGGGRFAVLGSIQGTEIASVEALTATMTIAIRSLT